MQVRTLDEARHAVALNERMNLPIKDIDKWGFESPTQFYVVAIPLQHQPELDCIVNKNDGAVFGAGYGNRNIFADFGREGVRIVGDPGRSLEYEWVREMLKTRPAYPV